MSLSGNLNERHERGADTVVFLPLNVSPTVGFLSWLDQETHSSDVYLYFTDCHWAATLDNELLRETSPASLGKEGRPDRPLRT